MNQETIARYFPWAVVVLAACYLLVASAPAADKPEGMHLEAFGHLPCQDGGRIMPLDSKARNLLLVISNRQTVQDTKDNTRPAIFWLAETMAGGQQAQFGGQGRGLAAFQIPLFRIENDEVLNILGLKPRDGFRYSVEDIGPKIPELRKRANKANQKESADHDLVDKKIVQLAQQLEAYTHLFNLDEPQVIPPESGEDWGSLPQALDQWTELAAALQANGQGQQPDLRAAILRLRKAGADRPAVSAYVLMLDAYARGDAETFNSELDGYQAWLAANRPGDVSMASFETGFNHFEPFYQCALLYVLALLLTFASWLVWPEPLRRAAFWLIVLIAVVNTIALCARMYISGRPPVTNLYTTGIFIGWACAVGGIVLEAVFGLSIGNLVAAALGALGVVIAHNLPPTTNGDTIGVMQAVLDTNFWLATHVVCINLGYAATLVAGLIGMRLILFGVLGSTMTRDLYRTLGTAIYGAACAGTFLSFVGTVLGGIWGDQSWGRFWGWDPKENGALLIVIMNAIVLHARWGGLVQQRGMAVLTVLGNIVVGWSWFGVNLLNIGLHNYGWMEGVDWVLEVFVVSQLIVAGLGLLPMQYWRSYAALQTPRPVPEVEAPSRHSRPRRGHGSSTAISPA
jgi:ABC-type transport system involved in cytochrome c biogenesis permease subunit